MLSDELT
jgi:small-conductance mechanosensitive channel